MVGRNVVIGEHDSIQQRGGSDLRSASPPAAERRPFPAKSIHQVHAVGLLRKGPRQAADQGHEKRRADAFIALPGSFGTREEMMEVLTLKQLGYHNKPCAFINTRGFYDWLFAFFGTLVHENFLKEASLDMFAVCATPEAAFEYMDGYESHALPQKWF